MPIILGIILLIPGIVILSAIIFRYWWSIRNKKAPVKDKLLRAPGESLFRQIEQSRDKTFWFMVGILLYGPIAFWVYLVFESYRKQSASVQVERIVILLVFVIIAVVLARVVLRQLYQLQKQTIGWRGERAVGEELNQLMRKGVYVFHDIPGNGNWNIDHVIVAPTGVFAIETKTRSKHRKLKDKNEHQITYNGKYLEFPRYNDSQSILQVQRNAKWLSNELQRALAENVVVIPVLAFPGWYVISQVKPEADGLRVINPKQIESAIYGCNKPILDNLKMRKIAYILEQRCRDVEF